MQYWGALWDRKLAMVSEGGSSSMAPDPTPGHLSDPSAAAGRRLSSLSSDYGRRALVRQPWETRYVRSVIASDAVVIAVVCVVGVLLDGRITGSWAGMLEAAIGPAVALALLVATHLARAWDPAVLGDGSAEYRRVARGYAAAAAVLGLAGVAAGLDGIRLWIFGVVPVACLFIVAGRFILRKSLHRRRAMGDCSHQVLAVGAPEAVADLIVRTRRNSHHGWTVTGACTPTGTGLILGVPVVGDLDAVASAVRRDGYRVVSVSAAPGWSPRRLSMLAWDLEEVGAELVVDPVLTELAGPRLRVEPVDELPLVRLTQPTLGGASLLIKSLVDRTAAAALLVVLAPLLLALAVAVRASGSPVMQKQIRIGRGGKPFTLLRFRCESETSHALSAAMRRYALDELPQLFNVLGGSMSLVGPRPPVPMEHDARPFDIHRTYPIKPGLTGLRQVSGFSDLTSEESARLDLRYVQNWSLAQDAVILWKAARAGVRSASV